MRRRTLDVVFSTGGIVLAGLLLVLGMMLASNASFARSYVADQMGEQKIAFKPLDALTDDERQSACLVENAGQALTTGKQAECYANEFIGLHLKSIPNADGKTYAELGTVQTELRAEVAQAQQSNDPRLTALQAELADVSAARETVFKGETLRGLLLTSYGFSIFGEKAGQAAAVLYGIAGLLAALGFAGFVHAFIIPKDERVRLSRTLIDGVPPHKHAAPKETAARAKAPAARSRRA